MPVQWETRMRLLMCCWNMGWMQMPKVSSNHWGLPAWLTTGHWSSQCRWIWFGSTSSSISKGAHQGNKMSPRVQCKPKPTRCVHPHCRFTFIQTYGIDNNRNTPLHHACYLGKVEAAECLLDHNADPSIRSEAFLLVFLCLLKWMLQINRVKLLFNGPFNGNNRKWLRCFATGVLENEVVCNCHRHPKCNGPCLYIPKLNTLWTSLELAHFIHFSEPLFIHCRPSSAPGTTKFRVKLWFQWLIQALI